MPFAAPVIRHVARIELPSTSAATMAVRFALVNLFILTIMPERSCNVKQTSGSFAGDLRQMNTSARCGPSWGPSANLGGREGRKWRDSGSLVAGTTMAPRTVQRLRPREDAPGHFIGSPTFPNRQLLRSVVGAGRVGALPALGKLVRAGSYAFYSSLRTQPAECRSNTVLGRLALGLPSVRHDDAPAWLRKSTPALDSGS